MIRGRRAHGAALATLATCAHLSPDKQARLHNAPCEIPLCPGARGSRPLTPQTLKMSAYGTLSLLRDPKGLANTVGAAHTRVRHVAGVQGNLLHPYHRALGRLQPVKAKPQAVASQALTGFQLHPLRIVLLLSRRWRGVKGGEAVHFTLDALSRPNTSPQGQVVGFNRLPCGAASEAGVWGKAPRC